jgi:cell division protein FtsL
MNHLENLAQTYAQAPWRRQLQIIGLFSLVLVSIALVAGIYLNVSAKAAAVGRDIQDMQAEIEELDREIEDLQSHLATILSSSEMEARALKMGFAPLPAEQTVYLHIPGYAARQPVVLAPNSQRTIVGAAVLPAQYTESLFDWARRRLSNLPTLLLSEVRQ